MSGRLTTRLGIDETPPSWSKSRLQYSIVGTMPLYDVVELLAKELRVNMVKMIIKVDIFFMIVMFYTTLYG